MELAFTKLKKMEKEMAELVDKMSVSDDKEFTQSVKDYIRDNNDFYNLYNKFVNLFDSDNIKVVWDNKTIQLFEKYERKEIFVAPQYSAEYEVYKYIIPYYRKHFFRKNTKYAACEKNICIRRKRR